MSQFAYNRRNYKTQKKQDTAAAAFFRRDTVITGVQRRDNILAMLIRAGFGLDIRAEICVGGHDRHDGTVLYSISLSSTSFGLGELMFGADEQVRGRDLSD